METIAYISRLDCQDWTKINLMVNHICWMELNLDVKMKILVLMDLYLPSMDIA